MKTPFSIPPARRIAAALLLVTVTGGILAACAVGPNYKAPAAPDVKSYVPGQLPDATATGNPQALGGNGQGETGNARGGEAQRFVQGLDIPGQWWTLYQSPELNAMIEHALAHSPTLDAAQAALRQANENVAAQRGEYYPSLTANAGVQRNKSTGAAIGQPKLGEFLYTLNSANVSVSYGLDIFGGERRAVEALQAQADYERYALEASYLTITSNIVTTAISEASVRAQIAATEEIAQSQQTQLDIIRRRINAGAASRTDLEQQQATLSGTLATLPPLRSQLAQLRNTLATYTGELPADYQGGAITLESLNLPAELPVSLPSKLVEQRPDVQQYAAQLHQTTAQVGVATANMLPQITLSGSYGGQATRFSDVFNPASIVWSAAASLTQPIFEGGKLLHQRRAAIAAAQEAAANYKVTVLNAFQDVANSLVALQADAEALAASGEAERAAAESLNLIKAQYKSGGASYTQVLTSEQTYQTAAINLVKAKAQRYSDTAALFQALGGGWWNRNDVNAYSHSSDCCKGS